MKKTLFLLFTLIMIGGNAWGEDWTPNFPSSKVMKVGAKVSAITAASNANDNDHWYFITQSRGGETPIWDNGTQAMRASTSVPVGSLNGDFPGTNSAYLVRFISTGSAGIYNIQFGNGKFLKSDLKTDVSQANAANYAFYNSNGGTGSYFGWNLNSNSGSRVDNNSAGYSLSLWDSGTVSGTSGNNIWTVYAVDYGDPVNVEYRVIVNGEQKANPNQNQPIGGTFYVPVSGQRAYCDYEFYSNSALTGEPLTTIPSEATTVYVKPIWNGPFSLSDVSENDMHWYYWKFLNTDKYCYNNSGTLAVDASKHTDVTGIWAFIGDPYNGIQIINKNYKDGSGNYLVLSSNGWGTIGLHSASDATYTTNKYFPSPAFHGSKGKGIGFVAGTYNSGKGINQSPGYYSSTDNGNVMIVEEVPSDYSANIVSEYASFFDVSNVGKYFGLTSDGYSELADDYTELSALCSESQYNTFKTNVASNLNLPATGFYLLYNANKERYLGQESNLAGFTTSNTAATIIKMTNNGNGSFGVQVQGQYIQGAASSGAGQQLTTSSTTTAYNYSIETAGQVKFTLVTGAQWPALTLGMNESYALVNQPQSNVTTDWIVTNAPSSVSVALHGDGASPSQTYYSTLCLPFDATISNATAYTLEKSGSWLVPTAVTDNKVPAGTAVLLKGTNETATATINTGDAFGSPLTCALVGTYTDKAVTKTDGINSDDYYLGIYSGVVGFYKWDGSTLGANRAYLPKATAEAAVKGFSIRWADETGVESIEHSPLTIDHEAGAMFDLSGRRVNKAQKGLYIQNGKKLLVK